MPYAGDTYSLPAGTAAVSSANANSSHVNQRFTDLESAQNAARPVVGGGTGQSSIAAVQASFKIAPFDAAATISGNRTFTGTVDFSGATVNGITASLADGTYGDITVSAGGTALSLNPDTVGPDEIADEAVTLAKLAHVATSTIVGRSSGGTGDPEALTATQVRALLNVEDGATAATGGWESVGTFYDNSTDGTVASIETPDFADGFEYRILVNDVSSTLGGALQIELYNEDDTAYSSADTISTALTNSAQQIISDIEILNPRKTTRMHTGRASSSRSESATETESALFAFGCITFAAQKVLRARLSFTGGSFDEGTVTLLRRAI